MTFRRAVLKIRIIFAVFTFLRFVITFFCAGKDRTRPLLATFFGERRRFRRPLNTIDVLLKIKVILQYYKYNDTRFVLFYNICL